eukprot:TRINITY_DN280_c0_g1_i4.p1 TRINITY_DN280_c0_g1~~TRINITY_DN280_c0_g1_i4.p1  ORF type:complete len:142 (+),score=25.30 TRINITY_DN280_c0_g1_i4:200-625(+)
MLPRTTTARLSVTSFPRWRKMPKRSPRSHHFPLCFEIPRKLGLATRLMRSAEHDMEDIYGAEYVSLHVRAGNYAAIHLYRETLGFKVHDVESKYYADGEDALDMRLMLTKGKEKAAKAKAKAVTAAAGGGAKDGTTPKEKS